MQPHSAPGHRLRTIKGGTTQLGKQSEMWERSRMRLGPMTPQNVTLHVTWLTSIPDCLHCKSFFYLQKSSNVAHLLAWFGSVYTFKLYGSLEVMYLHVGFLEGIQAYRVWCVACPGRSSLLTPAAKQSAPCFSYFCYPLNHSTFLVYGFWGLVSRGAYSLDCARQMSHACSYCHRCTYCVRVKCGYQFLLGAASLRLAVGGLIGYLGINGGTW